MHKPRIYFPGPLHAGQRITLDAQASQHLLRVLRLPPGAPLTVFNGRGGEYDGVLGAPAGKLATVDVNAFVDCNRESPLRITLCQGISRGERMDYTLQKAVELGVADIVPLFTERCEVRLRDERLARRVEHWQALIASACQQSGRTAVPAIHHPTTLADWLHIDPPPGADASDKPLKLVLDPDATQSLSDLTPPAPGTPVMLLIGPEGGLSDTEIRRTEERGFVRLRLGPRVLRTETAPVAVLAVLQSWWGDLG
ncbi:MAG: hypothetical protein FD165_2160 [Gammaproteobacteria bacterium]|nr:MAG: hypothetical protein FD165_2160 [Gammaproteobacteria bacterium]TND05319.1 MAG: hypothetical protein FD120_1194 [Gammaproteobacteria bacterium]